MFRYVILATNGRSWSAFDCQEAYDAANADDGDEDCVFVLPRLLREGWRPVRETPIGDSYALVLLSKEPEAATNGAPRPSAILS